MIRTFNQIYDEYVGKFNEEYPVLYFNDTTVTNKQFVKRVEELIGQLSRIGVRKGVGVGYTLHNGIDVIPLFIAISKLGAYAIPQFAGIPAKARMELNKKAKATFVVTNECMVEELTQAAKELDYEVKMVVVEESSRYESIYGAPECFVEAPVFDLEEEYDLPLMVASSSGTTGIPKMVCMSQKNVGAEMIAAFDMAKNDLTKPLHDVCGMAFPFSTSVMLVLCGMLLYGRTLAFSDDVSPTNYLRMIEKHKVNCMTCPPAYLESLLLLKDSVDADVSSVVSIGAGMDFCPPERLRRLTEMFPNLSVFTNGYGLVETCNIYANGSYNIRTEEIHNTATLHMAVEAENVIEIRDENGCPVQNGEEGEIYIKGANVVKGYMKAPDEVLEAFQDGWFRTGDIARKIDDVTFTLLGRQKYFIKRGGKSVSPIVVQAEINKTEGVVDSGVVGVPHPLYGEMIWAFVVKEEGSDVSLKEIKKQCKQNLPYYMMPDQVTFIDRVPKNPGVGKVSFETLKKMAAEELAKINLA